jgi:hypothetical protein
MSLRVTPRTDVAAERMHLLHEAQLQRALGAGG